MTDHDLIKALGGGTAVAAELSRLTGAPVDRERVYKWQENGIPLRFRIPLARILIRNGIGIPPGFLPEGLDAGALAPAPCNTGAA